MITAITQMKKLLYNTDNYIDLYHLLNIYNFMVILS